MRHRIFIIFLLIILSVAYNNVTAQNNTIKKDSSRVYRNIQTFSFKRKFTKFLYRLIFRPVATTSAVTNKVKNVHLPTIYKDYEGKIIRKINIVIIDPFGYTLTDTLVTSQDFLPKLGNKLHVKTQTSTIRNILLIRKNKTFDSLQVKESERLIRTQRYVHDVLFSFDIRGVNSDSVDISIRVLDVWTIIPKGTLATSHFTIGLADRNLAGLGHNIDAAYTLNHTNGQQNIITDYGIPNFRNTYISTLLHYQSDEADNYLSSINIERPFYSPLARWAGGFLLSQQSISENVINPKDITSLFSTRYNTLDVWGAEAWQIFHGSSEENRTTKLILSARILNIHYLDKPAKQFDTLYNYFDENFYLMGLGISTREYVKDKYIFNFGVIEDIPVGRTYGVVGGYQLQGVARLYWGARYAEGNYHTWGYLSADLECGEFVYNNKAQQGVFNASLDYFTGRISIGNWTLRQFIKPEFTIGIQRLSTDSLTLKESEGVNGINGFNSIGLTGTQRLLLKIQTQSYAPWNVLGFRFGPYFILSLGMLGNSYNGFKYSRLYSQIGIGALIRNDYWVINTFEISFAYYPSIPGNGVNVFKIPNLSPSDFGLIDFDLGKPGTVPYQ